MADTDTPPQQQQIPNLDDLLRGLLAPQQVPQAQPVDTADTRPSWIARLGETLTGGPPADVQMTQAQREVAGHRALINAGIGMMSAGPFASLGQGLAQGLLNAQASEYGSEGLAAQRQVAAQDWQQQQTANQLEKLKIALPLLRASQAGAIPNPLLGGPPGTTPGTSLATPGLTGDKSKDLPIIAQRESGGNPTALNYVARADPTAYARGATASGKYQIVNSTWAEGMKLAGLDPTKYPTAMSAPEDVQDKVAGALYDKYGTAPWDPTKFKQNWVPTPTGQFILASAARPAATPPADGKTPPPAAPGAVTAANAPPGVQVGGAPPLPPEAAPGAATGPVGGVGAALNPVAVKGSPIPAGKLQTTGKPPGVADVIQQGIKTAQATPVPPGTVLTAGPGAGTPPTATAPAPQPGWGTVVGSYGDGKGTTTPPAVPTPQTTGKADQPPTPPPSATVTPPASGGRLTFEQFQQQHPITIDPSTYTLAPPNLAQLQAAQAAAAQQLDLARRGLGGDPNKSLQDYKDAAAAVVTAQQAAQTKSAELQQAALKNAIDTQRQLYDAEMQRQQTVEENEKQRQAQIKIEQIKAGIDFHKQIAEQSATAAQKNTIEPMTTAAMKAHQMNLGLSQMLPILQDLPPGGGPLGSVLDAHPDLAPMFNAAGILNDRQADAVRLINGLVSNISTEMKPTGLGALREYEWDAFKAQLPSLMSTPTGQQKAVAMLMNMNNRIQDESNWMNNYYNRKIPDETATTPGVMRPAHDLDTDGKESVQQRMDRELGPVVPRYTGPQTGSGQAQWEASLPPGKPYYKTWAVPDPKNPGQPLRDSNGNARTTTTLEVRPWQ